MSEGARISRSWEDPEDRTSGNDTGVKEMPMNIDALIEEINTAYLRLSAATDELARSDGELAGYVRRVRLDNAEAILEAKNERTANLYLDGLLDTEEHQPPGGRQGEGGTRPPARQARGRTAAPDRPSARDPSGPGDAADERRGRQSGGPGPLSEPDRRPTSTPTGHPPALVVPEATGPLSLSGW